MTSFHRTTQHYIIHDDAALRSKVKIYESGRGARGSFDFKSHISQKCAFFLVKVGNSKNDEKVLLCNVGRGVLLWID